MQSYSSKIVIFRNYYGIVNILDIITESHAKLWVRNNASHLVDSAISVGLTGDLATHEQSAKVRTMLKEVMIRSQKHEYSVGNIRCAFAITTVEILQQTKFVYKKLCTFS